MGDQSTQLVQKLWNYCNILRVDGLSYLLARSAQASGDYASARLSTGSEQLTLLIFFKDGGGIEPAAFQQTVADSEGFRLGQFARQARRRIGNSLSPSAGDARQGEGHA